MPSGAVTPARLKPTRRAYRVNDTANAPNAEAVTARAMRNDSTALVALEITWSTRVQMTRVFGRDLTGGGTVSSAGAGAAARPGRPVAGEPDRAAAVALRQGSRSAHRLRPPAA